MISRSNYIAITLIMCIVLLMFQLTGISENVLMNEGENIYVREAVPEEQIAPEQQRYEQQQEQVELVEKGIQLMKMDMIHHIYGKECYAKTVYLKSYISICTFNKNLMNKEI